MPNKYAPDYALAQSLIRNLFHVLAVAVGSYALVLLERFDEVSSVAEADITADLRDRLVSGFQQLGRPVDFRARQVNGEIFAHFAREQSAEIAWAHMA